jgi:zinc transport system substrate-binding protein
MNLKKTLYVILVTILFISCNANSSKPVFVTSSFPVYSIISQIVGGKGKVEYIVPSGSSPHVYTPKPSDIKQSSQALAFFYAADNYDGWAEDFPAKNKVMLIKLLPNEYYNYFKDNHNHADEDPLQKKTEIVESKELKDIKINFKDVDPHFWMDPLAVKALIPVLIDTLSKLDPANANTYKINGELFIKRLDMLDRQLSNITENLHGKSLFLQHPSLLYFAKRYNLIYAGSIEETPGKEPSPKFIADLISKIKASGTKAIFSEPQLNHKAAKVIAEEANVFLFELNPVGGSNDIKNYSDLLLYNAEIIKKALE